MHLKYSLSFFFFYKNVVFPAQAEYSYFSADFIAYDINYKCLVSRSVSRYIVHMLHRFSLQSARSRCHVKRHLAVLALKKAFRTEIAWWKRKYPILFQLCQGQLSVITAVNSLLTSKGCLYMRNVCMVLAEWQRQPKLYLSFSKSQPRPYS